MKEARFAMLARSKPEASARLLDLGQQDIDAPLALLRAIGRRRPRAAARPKATAERRGQSPNARR